MITAMTADEFTGAAGRTARLETGLRVRENSGSGS
jgi:hypothetical protein